MPRSDRVKIEKQPQGEAEKAPQPQGEAEAPQGAPRPRRGVQRAAGAPSPGRQRGRGAAAKEEAPVAPPEAEVPQRSALLERYRNEVRPALMQEFGYRNVMQVPRLEKVVLNIGLAEALTNAKALDSATNQLAVITGQRSVTTKARKSIANFKLRKGMVVGAMVTLRGRRMYDFLDRLMNVALPRIRDFRGVSRSSFDGKGNFAVGLREQIVFPEVDYNLVDRIRGLQVIVTTTARTDQEGLRLLERLGMPFTRDGGVTAKQPTR
ncbi:MAG: 50S ribosomal protein L5 [Chloroflexi bacterium]|nr:50S ribosomal protein L5 [Chloroflexota bacterium]